MSATESPNPDRHEGTDEKMKDAVEEVVLDPHESEAELYKAPPGAGETDYASSSWSEDAGRDPTDVEVVNEEYP